MNAQVTELGFRVFLVCESPLLATATEVEMSTLHPVHAARVGAVRPCCDWASVRTREPAPK
jgi:hypothetical protein